MSTAEVVLLDVVLTVVVFAEIFRRAVRRSPRWIVKNRLPAEGTTYTVRVGGTSGTWNPAGKGMEWQVFGPGTGVYTRQSSPEGDVIHLQVTPKGWPETGGPIRNFSGPVPHFADRRAEMSPHLRRRRRIIRSMLVMPFLLGATGSGVALLLSTGDSTSTRTTAAVGGFFAGYMLFTLMLLAGLVANAVLKTLRGTNR